MVLLEDRSGIMGGRLCVAYVVVRVLQYCEEAFHVAGTCWVVTKWFLGLSKWCYWVIAEVCKYGYWCHNTGDC